MITQHKAEEYFRIISQIPHETNHEKELCDYLEQFAKEHALNYQRDDHNNIVIYEKATEGYENKEPIILQAHLDMFCDVKPDNDFDHHSVHLLQEGDCCYGENTSIGAESAGSIAVILTILEENRNHPDLICVFSAQKEEALKGAQALDENLLKAKRMICFCGNHADETYIGSQSSRDVILTRVLHPMENHDPAYKLSIYGLSGGHARQMIDGRAHAAIVIARIFKYLIDHGIDVRLARLEGGQHANTIAANAYAVFVSITPLSEIEKALNIFFKDLESEYRHANRHMEMKIEEVEWNDCYSGEETDMIIQTMYLAPQGIVNYARKGKNNSMTLSNLGIASTYQHLALLHYTVFADVESDKNHICDQIRTIGNLFNMSDEETNDVRHWRAHRISPLRRRLESIYRSINHKNMKEVITSESLEASVFQSAHPDMDIVTIGLDIRNSYTYKESLNLSSLNDNYTLVRKLLEDL